MTGPTWARREDAIRRCLDHFLRARRDLQQAAETLLGPFDMSKARTTLSRLSDTALYHLEMVFKEEAKLYNALIAAANTPALRAIARNPDVEITGMIYELDHFCYDARSPLITMHTDSLEQTLGHLPTANALFHAYLKRFTPSRRGKVETDLVQKLLGLEIAAMGFGNFVSEVGDGLRMLNTGGHVTPNAELVDALHFKLHEFTTSAAAGKGGAPVPDVAGLSLSQWARDARLEDALRAPGTELADSTQLTKMLIQMRRYAAAMSDDFDGAATALARLHAAGLKPKGRPVNSVSFFDVRDAAPPASPQPPDAPPGTYEIFLYGEADGTMSRTNRGGARDMAGVPVKVGHCTTCGQSLLSVRRAVACFDCGGVEGRITPMPGAWACGNPRSCLGKHVNSPSMRHCTMYGCEWTSDQFPRVPITEEFWVEWGAATAREMNKKKMIDEAYWRANKDAGGKGGKGGNGGRHSRDGGN